MQNTEVQKIGSVAYLIIHFTQSERTQSERAREGGDGGGGGCGGWCCYRVGCKLRGCELAWLLSDTLHRVSFEKYLKYLWVEKKGKIYPLVQ